MNHVTKIFGPPGTGKTTTLLDLLERTLDAGTLPERVAYMTFTVKARAEAVKRTKKRFDFTDEQMLYFRTLHSIAYRELGVSGPMMLRYQELKEFAELIGMEMTGPSRQTESGLTMTNGNLRGDRFMTFDHLRRHRGQTIEEAYRNWREHETIFITRHFCLTYKKWKIDEGLLDFTDLLTAITDPLPVDVIFVDEAQDLSFLQWRTLEKLAANAKQVIVAGDDDQAIFAWAGANPEELLTLQGEAQVLGQSHRVPRVIHELAGKMISRVKRRQPKEWKPRRAKGQFDWLTDQQYADYDREGSYLVLYRNHYLGQEVEAKLRLEGVPFGHQQKPTVGGAWSNAIVWWEALRKRGHVLPAQLHGIYEAMTSGRGISRDARVQLSRTERQDIDLDTAREEMGLQTDAPWFEALDKIPHEDVAYIRTVVKHHGAKALTRDPKVHLSTIHAAKGGEADHVVLLTDLSRVISNEIQRQPDHERRVFYVGLTRARESLQLVGFNNPLFSHH